MTQLEGFRPAGRQSKRGRCTLCGNVRTLTKAHVPPKAAFNQGNLAWGGTTSDNRLTYGRAQLGGANRYAHCNACRAITSPWDDEYVRWAHCFAGHLVRSPLKGQRAHIAGELDGVRPGRFIRSALAGMTALTPRIIDSHPELIQTVREWVSALPSEDIRFLVAIAPNGSRAHVEGSHDAHTVHMARDVESGEWAAKTRPAISAVIHFAPFSLLLTDRSLVDAFPHVDCTDWLQYGVDDVAKVSFAFPVVDLPATPDSPVPISMLHFIESKT